MAFTEYILLTATNNAGTVQLSASAVQETDKYTFDGLRYGLYRVNAEHTSPHFTIDPVPVESLTLTDDGFILVVDQNYDGINFDIEEILYKISGLLQGHFSRFDTTENVSITVTGTNTSSDIFTNTAEFSETFDAEKNYRFVKPNYVRKGTYDITASWPEYAHRYSITPSVISIDIDTDSDDSVFTIVPLEYWLTVNVTGEVDLREDFKLIVKGSGIDIIREPITYDSSYEYQTPGSAIKGNPLSFVQNSYATFKIKVFAFDYDLELVIDEAKYVVTPDPPTETVSISGDTTVVMSVTLEEYTIGGNVTGDTNEIAVGTTIAPQTTRFPVTVEIDGINGTTGHAETTTDSSGDYVENDVTYGKYKVQIKDPENIDSPLR